VFEHTLVRFQAAWPLVVDLAHLEHRPSNRIVGVLRDERSKDGTAMLVVEQNLDFALRVADSTTDGCRPSEISSMSSRRGRNDRLRSILSTV
jgi:hypothetical protein